MIQSPKSQIIPRHSKDHKSVEETLSFRRYRAPSRGAGPVQSCALIPFYSPLLVSLPLMDMEMPKNSHVSSILVVNDLLSDPLAYGQRKKCWCTLIWPNEIPNLRILGMNKRNKISSEMFQRAVVKGSRYGPYAGECFRPKTLELGRMLFLCLFFPLIWTFSRGH